MQKTNKKTDFEKYILSINQKILFGAHSRVVRFGLCAILVFIFGLGFSAKASAATYYVDNSIVDTNVASATPDFTTYNHTTFSTTGGSDSVFKTIKDINAKVLVAGDVVKFRRGDTWTITDSSYLQLYETGSAELPITITDYGSGELPVITSTAGSYAVRINSSYWNISNLNIQEGNPSLGLTGTITGINLDNCTFEGKNSVGVVISVGVNGITVTDSTFSPTSATGIVTDASTGTGTLVFDSCTFTGTVSDYDIKTIGNSNTSITNSIFTSNIGNYKSHVTFQGTGKTGTHILTGNTVNSSSNASWLYAGPGSNNYDLTITDNEINLPNCDAVGGYSSAIWVAGQTAPTISRNTISMNNGMGAIYVVGSGGFDARDAIITDNIIYLTENIYGIRLGSESSDEDDGKLDGATISGNRVYGPLYYDHSSSASGHAVFVGHNIATVKDNYVNGGGYGLVIKGTDTDWNYSEDISGNILINCHSQPTVYFKGVRNVNFYNNTIYTDPQYIQYQPFGYVRLGKNSVGGVPIGINMYNNVIYGKADSNFYYIEDGSDFTSDYNLMKSNQGSDLLNSYSQIYSTLSEWKNAGYDSHSFGSNPYFSNADADDFTLLSTSPAIDAGTDVSLTTDYAGNPIYGTPDIGAYEYQPTHTMVASANDPQIGESIRIYGDGKFRNTVDDSDSNSTDTANLSIVPQSSQTTKWLDLNISAWDNSGAYHKHWTENGDNLDHATETVHTVGDLVAGKKYTLAIDTVSPSGKITSTDCTQSGVCTADGTGKITFTYTGGYSDHTFDITDNIAPAFSNISPASGSTVSSDDTISFADSETTNPQCSLDNSHWIVCSTTVTSFSDLTGWSSINEGDTFTLYLKDTDAAGNTGTDQVDNLTKADESAPVRDDGSPSGALSSGTTSTTISLTTSETATCKYATSSGTTYADMTNEFDTTNSTTHTKSISGLTDGDSYNYYVRCEDASHNANDTDYLISFSVATPNTDENTNNDTDDEKDLNIHNVKAESTENTIIITWKTDHNTKSTIRYGTNKNIKEKKRDNDKEKKHKVVLKDLQPDTKYYFRIKATDSDDNKDSSRIHDIMTKPAPTPVPNSSQDIGTNNPSVENQTAPENSNNVTPSVCTYTVQQGDTLWGIAQKEFGDGSQYKRITDLNHDLNTDTLKIGEELKLCDPVKSPNGDNGASSNQSQQNTSNSNSENSNQQTSIQDQIQPQTETKTFHWWNPFSWF